MRSISIKIFLVLVVISLIGALFTSFYIQYRTREAFDDFIKEQYKATLVNGLVSNYQANGSWVNAEEVFQSFYDDADSQGNLGTGSQNRNPNRPAEGQPPAPFVLTDANGTVIAGLTNHPGFQVGDQIVESDLRKSFSLEIDGDIVGYLVALPISPNRNNIQINFLQTVQRGLIISTVGTLLIALVLGGILIMSFTRPIHKLVDATERVASGDLGYQVQIKSNDELGRLAESFNSMSRDLKNADRNRKQMTADIAHDLRTPLSVLQGYTEAMSEGKLDGTPEIYQVMHLQAQHLNYLIDDLRTLSLLDSEELNFQTQNIAPAKILEQAQASFQPLAEEKELHFSLAMEGDLARVNLDPDRLTQVLGNLINNAINVLPSGGHIWLKAHSSSDELIIEVVDDGPGIAPEDLPNIFHRHYRIDKSRSKKPASSGLGLAIAKKLVEAQGGTIDVQSQADQGTTFTIHFPAG